jgi:CheY-like chemotaxis protein
LQECFGEAKETRVAAAETPAEERRAGLRVLLAEDNVVNQRLTSWLLEKMAHTVTIAGNGQIALQLLAEEDFDLVAMDMQMPIMDGLEATEKIRAAEKKTGRHMAIVAMTANAFEEDRERCRRAGMGWLHCQTCHFQGDRNGDRTSTGRAGENREIGSSENRLERARG